MWKAAILLFLASCTLPDAKLAVEYEKTKVDASGQRYLPKAYSAFFSAKGSSPYHSARIDVQCCSGTRKTFGETGTMWWCKEGTYKATLTIKDTNGNSDTDEKIITVK
jgi:hypothetical protein